MKQISHIVTISTTPLCGILQEMREASVRELSFQEPARNDLVQ